MPDIWTQHPDIVRDLLKEAGFTCGVEGRFLKGRDPAWTCIYDGKTMKGDLYIHRADQRRSEVIEGTSKALAGAHVDEYGLSVLTLLLGFAVALIARRWRRS